MSEIDHIPEEVIAKIQKLLKLEESATKVGNLEEAANAAGKARDIMMKHNLDMYKVRESGDKTQKKESIGQFDRDPDELTRPHEGDWVLLMVKAICPHFLCKALTYSYNKKVCIVGTTSNVEIVWYTVEQLCNRIRPISRASFRAYDGKEKRNTYFRGFYRGAVEGIKAQLAENAAREVWKAKQAEEEKRQGNSMTENENQSLMMIGMQVEAMRDIDRYMNENMNVRSIHSKGSSLSGVSGKVAGYETGKKMNISSGLGSGSTIPKTRRLN